MKNLFSRWLKRTRFSRLLTAGALLAACAAQAGQFNIVLIEKSSTQLIALDNNNPLRVILNSPDHWTVVGDKVLLTPHFQNNPEDANFYKVLEPNNSVFFNYINIHGAGGHPDISNFQMSVVSDSFDPDSSAHSTLKTDNQQFVLNQDRDATDVFTLTFHDVPDTLPDPTFVPDGGATAALLGVPVIFLFLAKKLAPHRQS